jgi:hypothetical protein
MTPNLSNPSLCRSCTRGMQIQGAADSQEVNYCRSLEKAIRWHVTKCSGYNDKRLPDINDLKQIAWDIIDKGGKKIGFRTPEDRKKLKIDTWDENLSAPWEK